MLQQQSQHDGNGPAAADFFVQPQKFAGAAQEEESGLCCCEFVDKDNKRFHILGCCCECNDFDEVFTRLITCRRPEPFNQRGMLLTFQDRLRIPWRGGAKQVSSEALVPIFALPLIICIGAINAFTCTIMFLSSCSFIGYMYFYVQRSQARSRFFFMWLFWSILYLIVLFEYTVPMMELLPEENLILVLLTCTSLFSLWRAKQRANLNHVVQSTVAADELPDITEASAAEEEEEEAASAQTALLLEHDLDESALDVGLRHQPSICSSCHKYVPARTAHCSLCGACIMRRDHHSIWLDCCIGEWNHRYYIAGLVLGELALLLGANLTLTAVCHPFLIIRLLNVPVMLPDDCSEVFDVYELGISFVIAAYALLIATYILVAILRQIYFISRGTTMHECQRGYYGNSKPCLTNWKAFLF